ncbi:MAG: hypothetical protein WKF75_21595 [Singulisphaera sp.]
MSQVHLALAHYFANRDKIDEVIKRELQFDRTRSLHDTSMTLPPVGPSALVETGKKDAS